MKKIALIYSGARYFGGVETYLLNLFENVDQKKIHLELITLGDWELGNRLKRQGFSVVQFSGKWWNFLTLFKIALYLRRNKFSLIVSQGLVSNFYGRLSSLFSGVPSLVTVHSDYKYDYPNWKRYIYFVTFRPLDGLTKKYIVVSDFLKKELIGMGIKPQKITVIYNGIKDCGATREEANGKIVLGSLGRLHYKKGYDILIKALKDTNKNYQLKIWGDGEEKEKLVSLIKKLNLDDRVYLMGFTSDIKKALTEIDIYIQPSREEGFGLTVAEAMLAQKPIIVTPAGSLPELVVDGKSGIITKGFEPTDIVEAIKKMETLDQKKLGIFAREEASKRFNLKKSVLETESVYTVVAK